MTLKRREKSLCLIQTRKLYVGQHYMVLNKLQPNMYLISKVPQQLIFNIL